MIFGAGVARRLLLVLLSLAALAQSQSLGQAQAPGQSPGRALGQRAKTFADAGFDQRALVGQSVQLDGSRSTSLTGRRLVYAWSFAQKPAGSAASLSDPGAVRPTFTLDVAGTYALDLRVSSARRAGPLRADGDGDRDDWRTSRVLVSTVAVPPVARAGLDRAVAVGATIGLDGARSFDENLSALSYDWTLIARPDGSAAALSDAGAVRPHLTIDQPGLYVAQLIVTDQAGLTSAPARVAFSTRQDLAPSAQGDLAPSAQGDLAPSAQGDLAPRLSAGPAQTIAPGGFARIDGQGTYAPDGAAMNAAWALISAPVDSTAALATASDARKNLAPDKAGDYVVEIFGGRKTHDRRRRTDDGRSSVLCPASSVLCRPRSASTVLISTGAVAPRADAGPDQAIALGAAVALDGARSTDVDGRLLTYTWALLSAPAGSQAALDDAHAVRPHFTADLAGTYVAQLIVSDGALSSVPANVVLSGANVLAPRAKAGPDALGQPGASVALDGSRSSDPQNAALAARWSILGLGDQLTGSLSSPNALATNFAMPVAGVPLAQAVLVGPAALALAPAGEDEDDHHLALASAGQLTSNGAVYAIWRVRNRSGEGAAPVLASEDGSFAQTLAVPAQSDLFVATPVFAHLDLSAGGREVSEADASSRAFSDQRLVGGGPPLKLSIVQLDVSNALFSSYDDVAVSSVEARPQALIAGPATGFRGVALALDATGSQNPNAAGGGDSGLTFSWSLLARPAKSALSFSSSAARLTLTPDSYGLYVVQLIVSDGVLPSRPKTFAIQIVPRPPLAVASGVSPIQLGQSESLDGSGSSDPDGNALTYAWSLVSAPSGSTAALSDAAGVAPKFTPDLAGTYVAQLIVKDPYGASTPATFSVLVQSGLTIAPLGPQSVALGASLSFTLVAKDPSGAPVTFSVLSGALPPGATFNAATGAFFFRPTQAAATPYQITFGASDGAYNAALSVAISVTGQVSGTTGALDAQVLDAVDYAQGVRTPVVGAIVSVDGISATSDSSGAIALAGLPAGTDTLLISGASAAPAPDGSTYSDSVVSASILGGVTNALNGPILLGRAGTGAPIVPGGVTTVTNPALGVTLTLAPNTAFNADGTPFTGALSIGSLPPNTPIALPPGFSPCQLLTISPIGVTFNPPAQLSVQNQDALPAGTNVDLWAFDLALSNARVVGVGQVSTDGKTIAMLVGGVPGGTILAMMPRRPVLQPVATQPNDSFVPSVLGTGDLAASFSPPGLRELNAGRDLTFVYHSTTADPKPVLDVNALIGANTGLPSSLQTSLTVDGVTQPQTLTTDLATPLAAGGAALSTALPNALRQAGVVDGAALTSGVHAYSFLTLSRFSCSTVAAQVQGSFVVNNQTQSAFGPGWSLAELQKLTPQPDGSVLVTEGNGRALAMRPQQAPSFIPNPVYVPVDGPFRGALADLQNSGRPDIVKLGWKDGSLNVILNKGGRQFVKAASFQVAQPGVQNADGTIVPDASDVAVGDLNGDGNPDIALVASKESRVKIFYGATGGTFTNAPVTVENNVVGGNVMIGDWEGNGLTDLGMSEHNPDGSGPDIHPIWQNSFGSFSFAGPMLVFGAGRLVDGVKTVRLPGDVSDSFVGVLSDGTLGFFYPKTGGSFNGSFNDQITLPGPTSSSPGRVLDVAFADKSGGPTVAVAGVGVVYVAKWVARGDFALTQTLTLPNGLTPDSVTLAPLAKGDLPSLLVTTGNAGFYVYPNDGTGTFGAPVFIATPFRTGYEIDVGDFDGDGIADVALNDIDNDRVAIFFGAPNPTGAFVSPIGDYTRLVQNADGTYSRIYNDGTIVRFDAKGFQTQIKDANGNTTSYSYNSAGQLTSIVEPTGASSNFTYAGGFLASTTDPAGRTTSFQHDAAGDLTQVTDPNGKVTQYLYDANHALIATIDPNANTSTNTYTATGQLSVQTFPDGSSVKLDVSRALGLDALGGALTGATNVPFVPAAARISLLQDALGHVSETEVNEYGSVIRAVDTLGRTSLFERNAEDDVVQATIPAGTITGQAAPTASGTPQVTSSDSLVNQYAYDSAGDLTFMHEAIGQLNSDWTPLDRTTTWIYEPVHDKLASKTDPGGFTTSYSYDASGNMLARTDALGGVLSFTYNAQGLPLTKKDPLGNVTTYAYDANGDLTHTIDAAGTDFDRYYDASGNTILTVDATGTSVERRRAWRYDADNRVLSQTSATGQVTSYAYDSNGNVTQVTNPAGDVTTRVYDMRNRLVSESDPASGTTAWTYDANNNALTSTDSSGAVTSSTYDSANRLISTKDPLGGTRSFTYDLRDDMTSLTDARGAVTSFTYDVLKHEITRTEPGDGANPWYYSWDSRDHLIGHAAPGWSTFGNFTYDALSRLVSDNQRTYRYDADSNLTYVSGEYGGSSTYVYDSLNRVVSKASAGFNDPITLTYAYDPLSRRTSMSDSMGGTTSYAYDGEDRLTSLTTPWGGVITQTYDSAGRPLRLAYPNGLDADLSFESSTGRLASIITRAGTLAAPLASYAHTYDSRGDLATLTNLTGAKSFAYDPDERLTGVAQAAPTPATQIESYAYDPEGNRTASQLSTAPVVVDSANHVLDDGINTYSWDVSGELLSRTPKSGAPGDTFNYSFLTSRNSFRLDSVTGADATNFYYSPNEQIGEIDFKSASSGSGYFGGWDYWYDGDNVALEQRDHYGSPQWVRYVFGQGTDQPLAMEIYPPDAAPTPGTGKQYYFHADGEGSIRLVTDANGQTVDSYSYDSYGNRTASVETVPQLYGWKGETFIPGLNQYYDRARFYDPVLGRFTSEDPLGFSGGDTNLYDFAWDNPHNWNDPSGMFAAEAEIDEMDASLVAGAVPIEGGTIETGAEAAEVIQTTRSALQKVGADVACTLFEVAAALDTTGAGAIAVTAANCGVAIMPAVVPIVKAKPKQSLPPCSPPEGTMCFYGPDWGRDHSGLRPHYHVYQMQRKWSTNGECYWRRMTGKVGKWVFPSQPTGMMPCSSYPGFRPR